MADPMDPNYMPPEVPDLNLDAGLIDALAEAAAHAGRPPSQTTPMSQLVLTVVQQGTGYGIAMTIQGGNPLLHGIWLVSNAKTMTEAISGLVTRLTAPIPELDTYDQAVAQVSGLMDQATELEELLPAFGGAIQELRERMDRLELIVGGQQPMQAQPEPPASRFAALKQQLGGQQATPPPAAAPIPMAPPQAPQVARQATRRTSDLPESEQNLAGHVHQPFGGPVRGRG